MSRFILFCLSLIVSFSAFAAESCFEFQATYAERTTGWYLTKEKACSALNGGYAVGGNAKSKVASNSKPNDFGGCNLDVTTTYEGGTVINGGGTGSLQSRQTDQCTPPPDPDQCSAKAGKSEIVNITSGWSRDGADTTPSQVWAYTNKFPPSGVARLCSSDGCQQSIDLNESCPECRSYTSLVPAANGLYRKSDDFRAHYDGSACDSSKIDIPRDWTQANDARDPPCPGYVGEVNGVRGCFGTADKPVRPTDPQLSRNPQESGNPAAGPKPSSGEGSGTGGTGRTPSAGTGGSAGGPAGAAAGGTGSGGSRPDGTTNKPSEGKEQQACGAPGQPKCAIDESGMPNGKSAFDGSKSDLDKADRDRSDMLSRIKDTSDKNTSWGQSFSWVQHGGCQPWDLGVLPLGVDIPIRVNICPIMPYIEWVTSFLWAITTFALTIGMVFRVTSSSSS